MGGTSTQSSGGDGFLPVASLMTPRKRNVLEGRGFEISPSSAAQDAARRRRRRREGDENRGGDTEGAPLLPHRTVPKHTLNDVAGIDKAVQVCHLG